MKRTLIIGATGTVGRQVVARMAAMRAPFRALTRHPEAAHLPAEIEIVAGDLTVPETLGRCLDGVDAVFLVWTAPPDAVAPALERIARHARRIVYLSAPIKTAHPFFQKPQPNPSAALHRTADRNLGTPVGIPAARNDRRQCPQLVGPPDPRRHGCALAVSGRTNRSDRRA